MSLRRALVILMSLLLSSTAWADDLAGQAMATHWKFMGLASGSGASMRPRAASYVEVRTATCIAVARRQRMISIPSSRGGRSIVRQSPETNMGGL
jgi:hypothetical protein